VLLCNWLLFLVSGSHMIFLSGDGQATGTQLIADMRRSVAGAIPHPRDASLACDVRGIDLRQQADISVGSNGGDDLGEVRLMSNLVLAGFDHIEK
jgi:hypothetical protein